MTVLICHPGSVTSTADVYAGLAAGLRAHDIKVIDYALHGRLYAASHTLKTAWRLKRRKEPNVPGPTFPDICYQACLGIFEKILRFRVDVVIVISGVLIPGDVLELLRTLVPVGILLTESPYLMQHELALAKLADVVWTNERSAVDELRAIQPRTSYLPHAWLPGVHNKTSGEAPAHDVVFVGSGFSERVELLEGVDWTGIDLGLYGNWRSVKPDSPLQPFIRSKEIPNTQAVALYRHAKIGLNIYRTTAGIDLACAEGLHIEHAESLNPRAYELAATGSFHLSTPRDEVREIFGPTVPTFETSAELSGLLRYWLLQDAERQAVAARLPALVAESTWIARGGQVINDLRAVVGTRAA